MTLPFLPSPFSSPEASNNKTILTHFLYLDSEFLLKVIILDGSPDFICLRQLFTSTDAANCSKVLKLPDYLRTFAELPSIRSTKIPAVKGNNIV